jgi:ubiquitin carboxyl-terminal hydrolase L5
MGKVINNSCGTLAALNAVMNIAPEEGETPEETISHGVRGIGKEVTPH